MLAQAGGKNEAKEVKMPAGLPRLFKSALDWNLYSSLQHAANDRQAGAPLDAASSLMQKHHVDIRAK